MCEDFLIELLSDESLGDERLLNAEEEKEIFNYYKENSSNREIVQTILIKANKKLVYSIAKYYKTFLNNAYEDIIQFGMIGLSKAVDRFEVEKNVRFSTYATYWIRQSITKGIKFILNSTSSSSKTTFLRKEFIKTEDELTQELKRNVTFNEISLKMGFDPSDLAMLLNLTSNESLDIVDDENKRTLVDTIVETSNTPQEEAINIERQEMIQSAISKLNNKEQVVIKLRYGYVDGKFHSFSEIATNLNISRQRAQIIEKDALYKMKQFINEMS